MDFDPIWSEEQRGLYVETADTILVAGEGNTVSVMVIVIAITHSVDFSERADVVYRLEKHKLVQF